MKKTQIFVLMFFSLSFILQAQTKVSIDPDTRHQEIEGWGSSLCWWANKVGKWSNESKIDQIIDFMTHPDKMNMNIFRYNIGGGDNPSHYSTPSTPGHMAKGKGERCEMDGFWPGKDEAFDWTKDAGQLRVLQKINTKRSDAIFEAFSNSPPYWMTRSGCSSGVNGGTSSNIFSAGLALLAAFNVPSNLKEDHYGDFCYYLVEVCKHIKETYEIEFRTIEPFNEPSLIAGLSAWHTNSNFSTLQGGTQEGCHFKPEAQKQIVPLLFEELQKSGLNTVISAADETNISLSINTIKEYEKTQGLMDMIGQINTHTYDGTDANRRELLALATKHNKRLWQSETGPLNIAETGLISHLKLAQILFDDMKVLKPSAWIDWQFMEEGNLEWSQINGNFQNEIWNIGKNAYVRMQVTRFIKQGYTLIENDNKSVLTAISPDQTELVIVVLNTETTDINYEFDLSAFHQPLEGKRYRTSANENCYNNPRAGVETTGKKINYSAPRESITTFVIPCQLSDNSNTSDAQAKTIVHTNTTEGELTITNLSQNARIGIFTTQGVPVYQKQASDTKMTFTLPTGIYLLKVQDGNTLYKSKVLIR